jgi:D-serine deaminase-like pyridoxal phosphate-dependent protein
MPQATEAPDLRNMETPVLVLDQHRMDANIRRMRDQLARLGVAFRPHVKTSKSIDVARRTIGAPTGPITVSTLKEAELLCRLRLHRHPLRGRHHAQRSATPRWT